MMFRTLSKVLLVFTLVSTLPSLESAAAAKTHHRAAQGRKHRKKHHSAEHGARKGHDPDRPPAQPPSGEL